MVTVARKSKPPTDRFSGLRTPGARRTAFLAFFALVALCGGGARGDIVSLIILRPAAVMMGTYALLVMPLGALRPFRAWIVVLVAAALVIGWQLVPLPPELWQALPGRQSVADLDRLLKIGDVWRPASLSPAATWNALVSLVVPGAALLLYAAMDGDDRQVLFPAIAIMAAVSAVFGLLQLVAGPESALYLYRITNGGLPVGLFSNRNHHAIFLAAALPAMALWLRLGGARQARWAKPLAAGLGVLFTATIILAGSRAGLLLVVPAAATAILIFAGTPTGAIPPPAPPARRFKPGIAAAAAAIVAGIFVLASGSANRLWQTDLDEEIRYQSLPTVLEMAASLGVTGAGAGSFPLAYQRVEPTELLRAQYLNHVHNDYLELPIELGLPGVLVLAAVAALLAALLVARTRQMAAAGLTRVAVAVWAIPAIFALASLVDYPLRTPSLAMIFFAFAAAVGDPLTQAFRERPLPRKSKTAQAVRAQ